jgi:phage tail sheath gpL-like
MASPNIAFDSIPSSIRKPGKYFEFNTKLAVRTLPGNLQRLLIVGQRLAAGSVLANTLVDVFSDSDAATFFGRGSIAHLMVLAAYCDCNG